MSMAPLRRELEIPQAKEAEEAIIGVCLLNNDLIWDAIELVQPWEFLNSRNRLVFKTMCEMMQAGEGVDPLTLRKKLRTGTARVAKTNWPRRFTTDLSNFIDRQPRVDFYRELRTDRLGSGNQSWTAVGWVEADGAGVGSGSDRRRQAGARDDDA